MLTAGQWRYSAGPVNTGVHTMRTMMILAATAAMFPSAANATHWVIVAETPRSIRYIDADAVVLDDRVATLWLKTEYVNKGKSGETLTIEKWMHDCAHARAKLLALTLYKADGSVIGSAELPRYRLDWAAIVPGSTGETVHQRVCSIVNGTDRDGAAEKSQLDTI
jgi:hypothetical protein